jgi:ankyrin repeat protein
LHWAAAAGDLAALKVFLGKERSLLQKLSPKADQQLALHVAAAFGRKEIVKYLLDNNVVKEEEDQKERTALYIAVMQDNTAIAKMLLQNGANPNISPKYSKESQRLTRMTL